MQSLITKEQAAAYLGLKTPEAAEKLLARLGVPVYNFGIVGSKGVRYRLSDMEESLERVKVEVGQPKRKKARKVHADLFSLPIKDQVRLLTSSSPAQ